MRCHQGLGGHDGLLMLLGLVVGIVLVWMIVVVVVSSDSDSSSSSSSSIISINDGSTCGGASTLVKDVTHG